MKSSYRGYIASTVRANVMIPVFTSLASMLYRFAKTKGIYKTSQIISSVQNSVRRKLTPPNTNCRDEFLLADLKDHNYSSLHPKMNWLKRPCKYLEQNRSSFEGEKQDQVEAERIFRAIFLEDCPTRWCDASLQILVLHTLSSQSININNTHLSQSTGIFKNKKRKHINLSFELTSTADQVPTINRAKQLELYIFITWRTFSDTICPRQLTGE